MAITITTDGNGTATATSISVNQLVTTSVNQRYYGVAYTVTATPNAGYAFDNMVLDWDIDEYYYDTSSSSWVFASTYHQYLGSGGVNPWASQIDNNITTVLDPTSIQCYLFEREIYRAATGAQNWERRYTLKNLNLYVTFKHVRPDPTHLIMRATNGVILRGGTQNKILRDD